MPRIEGKIQGSIMYSTNQENKVDMFIVIITCQVRKENISVHMSRKYTECKYGGPLGRRPGRVMKVRLVRPRCFVLTMLPLKSLAPWTV